MVANEASAIAPGHCPATTIIVADHARPPEEIARAPHPIAAVRDRKDPWAGASLNDIYGACCVARARELYVHAVADAVVQDAYGLADARRVLNLEKGCTA